MKNLYTFKNGPVLLAHPVYKSSWFDPRDIAALISDYVAPPRTGEMNEGRNIPMCECSFIFKMF